MSLATGAFSNYAFPSGHATDTAALWGATAWLLTRSSGGPRRAQALGAWLTAMVAIDASRVELGAHWLSDVIAGSSLGTAVLCAAVLFVTRHRTCPDDYLEPPG